MQRRLFSLPNRSSSHPQSGQIAVIVFLIMAVLLVIGLSLATRTSREIELANQQEDTTRVFNAAETGIEKALSDEANFNQAVAEFTPDSPLFTNVDVTTTITRSNQLDLETLAPGVSATVYITSGNAQGTITIKWGKGSDCNTQAAIIVSAYYLDGTQYKAIHQGYRPLSCETVGFLASTQFTLSAAGTNGFTSNASFTVPANTKFVRIKPLYNATTIDVSGAILDAQSHLIRSQASDASGTSTEVRTIEVTRQRPAPPSIFDYALYSGGTLSKL